MIAFLGAFVLVTYRLKEEKREQDDAAQSKILKIWSTNPRLVQVGPSLYPSTKANSNGKEVPTELLRQTHFIAITTGFIGFIFVVTGIMCYVWAKQSRVACILSSATLGTCIIFGFTVIRPLKRAESAMGRIEKGL